MTNYTLPAEWHPQSRIQLTWPHEETDWAEMLDEVCECFTRIAREVTRREPLLIVTPHPARVERELREAGIDMEKVTFFECPTNDTWARDHAFITLRATSDGLRATSGHPDGELVTRSSSLVTDSPIRLLDFCFNGWGMKFAAHLDNRINRRLHEAHLVEGEYVDHLDFVLEGGSIESDGEGTLMTTTPCLTAPNRNARHTTKEALEPVLCQRLGMKRVLWIDHGYLAGDDTDSHVDTLARLCPGDTIAYVQCTDPTDEHFHELRLMEEQLKSFRTLAGKPYRLVPLPMPTAIVEEGERLPATYANFLIMNGAVLMPTYGQPENDTLARERLQSIFPDREVVGIDCRPLIRQHGSLHCVTMQYPEV